MSVREGLDFEVEIASDTPPARRPGRRDPAPSTRTSTSCATRPAAASPRRSTRSPPRPASGIVLDEAAVPIPGPVRAACEMLGLDPFHVANEGKCVAIVAADRGRGGPRRDARLPRGRRGRPHRRGRRRPPRRWSRSGRSSAPSASSTCSSASSCPGSAEATAMASPLARSIGASRDPVVEGGNAAIHRRRTGEADRDGDLAIVDELFAGGPCGRRPPSRPRRRQGCRRAGIKGARPGPHGGRRGAGRGRGSGRRPGPDPRLEASGPTGPPSP